MAACKESNAFDTAARAMELIQIIYMSSAYQEYGEQVLDDILAASARNNAAAGVTGMLLYSQGTFLQILEGERAGVEETFARIALDARHHGVFELSHEPVTQRSFATWSMGFRRLTEADAAQHPAYAPLFSKGFDAQQLHIRPGAALDVLLQFSER